MRRRDFVSLIGSVLAAPFAVAQAQGRVWRVGVLVPRRRPESIDADFIGAFPRGMRELGYVEGKNLVIEWRFGDGSVERLPELAADLVRSKVDVIVCGSSQGIRELQKATATIPIVMATSGDPIGSGFVASLARPGGNITGLSNLFGDASPKQLELLLSVAPKLSRVALLINPVNPSFGTILKNVQSAAQKAGVSVLPVEVRSAGEIDEAFAAMVRGRAGAIIVGADSLFIQQARRIAELAARNRLPSVSSFREYSLAGGLLSYGTNLAEQFRRAAAYVDKILKGARPGDMPVEQSAILELIVNKQVGRELGLKIPELLLVRADRVIE